MILSKIQSIFKFHQFSHWCPLLKSFIFFLYPGSIRGHILHRVVLSLWFYVKHAFSLSLFPQHGQFWWVQVCCFIEVFSIWVWLIDYEQVMLINAVVIFERVPDTMYKISSGNLRLCVTWSFSGGRAFALGRELDQGQTTHCCPRLRQICSGLHLFKVHSYSEDLALRGPNQTPRVFTGAPRPEQRSPSPQLPRCPQTLRTSYPVHHCSCSWNWPLPPGRRGTGIGLNFSCFPFLHSLARKTARPREISDSFKPRCVTFCPGLLIVLGRHIGSKNNSFARNGNFTTI